MFERVQNIELSVIKQIEILSSKYANSISLAQGIPDFDTPECIKKRAEKAMSRGEVAKYTLSPGLPELREMIEIHLSKSGIYYDWQKEIIVTAGAIEAITATIFAITNPGDEIIIPVPTYTSYQQVIKLAGCKPIFVPLNEEDGWSFELNKYAEAITDKTKAIFYCNPNNPTGTVYDKKQLLGLAKLAVDHNLFIISDEVYQDFVFDNINIFSLSQLSEFRNRVIRIFSFSKSYAMTGWRVAYLHSDAKIINEILKVHDSLVTCAPTISQYAAMGALEMGEQDVKLFKNNFKERRDIVCEHLNNLSNIFSYVKPNSSYFIFPKIINTQVDSWKFCLDLIEKTKVALVPGIAFGPNGENHVRISFSRSEKDINEAFNRLKKYFK